MINLDVVPNISNIDSNEKQYPNGTVIAQVI